MKTESALSPPVAEVDPFRTEIHGVERIDNYHWLRDRDDKRVIDHLEAENAYTEGVMGHAEGLREALYKEMVGRIKETDESAPVPIDEFFYYQRTVEGLQYPIFCRKHSSMEADEEVLVDVNELAQGHAYFRLGAIATSPNHKLLAYSFDTEGNEVYTLVIKNLETGNLLPDEIPNTYYSVAWANDNQTLFYSVLNEAKRPFKLFRHELGSDPKNDEEVFHEPDEAFYLSAARTSSKRFILVSLDSNTTSEVHYLDASDPRGSFQVVEPRRSKVEYHVAHQEDRFVIWTNDKEAKNFRVVDAPISAPSSVNWREVIPHRPDVKVEYIVAFQRHLAIFERKRGLIEIRVIPDGATEHYVEFPEPVYTVHAGPNRRYETNVLRFIYTSLTTPLSDFDYNMDTKAMTLVKRQEVLGGYDPSSYETERLFAKAADGVEVPISVVYRKDFPRDGSRPLWLYGYGSYGISMDPTFVSTRLSALDRGFAFAIAHVRGGGDLGEEWKESGKLFNKRNTFSDFIACAEHLIAERFTSPQKLVISGGSAGGLLMGAVTNMRPDLFKAVVAQVPFVDVVTTILDPSLPLTVTEYEEWGNPNEKDFFDYMLSYSPYDNVEPKNYPHILVTAGLNDPRVSYWEPAKWVAKLRALKTDNNRLLLKTQMGAGHAGPSGRYDFLKEQAFVYSFVLDVLGAA